MRRNLLFAFVAVSAGVLGLGSGLGSAGDAQPARGIRTVFIVRHADTAPEPGEQDPKLTATGESRAARLAEVLKDEPLSAVFVTRTTRSVQTGTPIADVNGIEPLNYLPTGYEDLKSKVLAIAGGQSCLVVAHSNTVPGIVEALGGRKMEELPEKEFDRLIVLVLNGESLVRMIELRY